MKKIPDEEDKKTVMLMENRKRKGRLGSGALGPNSDPNPEVPLKIISRIKHKTSPKFKKFINMLDDRSTGVKTAESIVKELGSSPPPSRPRSRLSSTPWTRLPSLCP